MTDEELKLTCLQMAREDFIGFQQKVADTILKLIEHSHKDKHIVDSLTKDLRTLLNSGLPSAEKINERAREFCKIFKKNNKPVE